MIRALAGTIAIIALAMDMASGRWRWVLAFIAAVGLYTAIMRHCSPYVIMGISTKKCD